MKRRKANWAIMALLLFNASTALAQEISFLRSKTVAIGLGSTNITSGDFNGDGKLDLVVSSSSNTVLFLGNGDGTFKSVDLGFVASQTLIADVNRDKKADLIVYISPNAYVLLGNGDGTFQPRKLISGFPYAVADFDGDGKPDLLGGCGNGAVSVSPGNGDGTFRSWLPCSADASEGDFNELIAIADLNGDGKLDVVRSNVRGTPYIWVWLGKGDGTFQPPSEVYAGATSGAKPLAIGDLNHDGKLDIVVGKLFGVAILFGNGDGTFKSHDQTATSPAEVATLSSFDGITMVFRRTWTYSNDIFIRDLDGDGNPDIVLGDTVFRGKGDGTFYPAQFLGIDSESAVSVICEDLNGDGKPDIVFLDQQLQQFGLVNGTARMLSILLNNSPNSLSSNVLAYSAATGGNLLAPSSIASIYGKSLANVTASASGATFPTQLGGISLRVHDVTDTVRLAQLILVSPAQINFVVPAQTSVGPATLNIDDGSTPVPEGANATIVNNLAAGFFTASQNGQGVPAATAVRILADGTQEPVPVFTCAGTGQCNAVPIDMTSGLPVYMSLYGTGFGAEFLKNPASTTAGCQVGGKAAVVQFAGPHPLFPGLDQLNLLLPQSLPSGIALIQCQFNGTPLQGHGSNFVQIAIK